MRQGDPCYKVAKNLTEMLSNILWQVGLISDEHGYLIEEVSKQNVEDTVLFFLIANSKMGKEGYILKKKLLSKKEPELTDLENAQPIHIAKNEKVC